MGEDEKEPQPLTPENSQEMGNEEDTPDGSADGEPDSDIPDEEDLEEVEMPKSTWGGMRMVAYPMSRELSKKERGAVGAMDGEVRKMYPEIGTRDFQYYVHYAIWWLFEHYEGQKSGVLPAGAPTVLKTWEKFMRWYETSKAKTSIAWLQSEFPNWWAELILDSVAFQEKVQGARQALIQEKQSATKASTHTSQYMRLKMAADKPTDTESTLEDVADMRRKIEELRKKRHEFRTETH
jgi:hypothetical protein